MIPSLFRIIKLSTKMGKLSPGIKRAINAELTKSGLDGNGRFDRVGDALARIGVALANSPARLEWDTTLNAHLFMGDKGRQTLDIAFSDPTDPFKSIPITNSRVAITWQELENKKFEVIAYLS